MKKKILHELDAVIIILKMLHNSRHNNFFLLVLQKVLCE